MLILTRKTGQGFTIGDDIEITITEVSGDKVRVGINAPREVKILRSELSQTVEYNAEAATKVDTGSLKALAMGLKKPGKSAAGLLQPQKATPQAPAATGAEQDGAKEKDGP